MRGAPRGGRARARGATKFCFWTWMAATKVSVTRVYEAVRFLYVIFRLCSRLPITLYSIKS